MKLAIICIIAILFIVTCVYSAPLNIHIVPHTHDDVGWLKTVDEYFYGANNSIQVAGVQYILDSVIEQLEQNPERKFIYVEIAFFARWWNEQTDTMKSRVRSLVNDGRLEFINGGWCMNDEAGTHYNAIIDQMSLGLRFIRDEFGDNARPVVAWHIDPFGHSIEQASLHAQTGFDSFFFARIDYQDYAQRSKNKNLEFVWKSSPSLGNKYDIFTGALYGPTYGPPSGFSFDQASRDPPIQDDPNLFDFNVPRRVHDFLNLTLTQAKSFSTNNIMLTMGNDFNYQNANTWFKNLDKLIKYVNANSSDVVAFYSTPSNYTKSLYNANITWETKSDDFFPYADCPHCFWTGYFTSRPALKGYVRQLNSFLQSCKQIEVLSANLFKYANVKTNFGNNVSPVDILAEAMGVAQHHDAVSGTEKQHVADDYAKRLHIGERTCQQFLFGAMNAMINGPSGIVLSFNFCEYLNVSSCPVIESSSSFWVLLYNPIARIRIYPVNIPVKMESGYKVIDHEGSSISCDVMSISERTLSIRDKESTAKYSLHFQARIPAMGYTRYTVMKSNSNFIENKPKKVRISKLNSKKFAINIEHDEVKDIPVTINNLVVKVSFSADGKVSSVTNLLHNRTFSLVQDFFWYNSSIGNTTSKQASGAYIFRPNMTTPYQISKTVITNTINGNTVYEARQTFSNWVTQVVRLYQDQDFVEFEYTIGPIPYKDGLGKEIITRYTSKFNSNGVWYTDANGRSMQKRTRNFRPTWKLNQTEPVAGNYYPVNSRIAIFDDVSKDSLMVLNDRSQGGTSLKDGEIELMVHRRTLKDDKRGVAEPINETGVNGEGLIIRGKHYLLFNSRDIMNRKIGEEIMMSPVIMFHTLSDGYEDQLLKQKAVGDSFPRFNYSALNEELPFPIHLLTLARDSVDTGSYLIRLEHMCESSEYSGTVKINLVNLFRDFTITSATELTLGANAKLDSVNRLKFRTNANIPSYDAKSSRSFGDNLTVTLSPMEIRTFSITIKMNN